jgi:hypothetical protein
MDVTNFRYHAATIQRPRNWRADELNDAKAEGVALDGAEGIDWQMPLKLLCVFIGTVMVYSCLFSIGSFIYGNIGLGIGLGVLSITCCYGIFAAFGKIRVG